MKIKIYEYAKCSTCRDALKFLDSKKVAYEKVAIVDQPPTVTELKKMLTAYKEKGGSLKSLFNTSGLVYKAMNLAEKFPTLTEAEALKLLSQNGKLIKRPFVIGDDVHLLGFKEADWKKVF